MNFLHRGFLLSVIASGAFALSSTAVAQHRHGGGSHGHSGGSHSSHSGGGHSFSGHRSGSHHGGFRHHGGHRRHHGGGFLFYPYYSAFYGSFYPGYGSWGYYPGYGYGGYGDSRGYAKGGGSVVTDVQSALADAGYYRGEIDGVIGNGTRNAIRRFQRDNGLPVTGRLDQRLLDALDVG